MSESLMGPTLAGEDGVASARHTVVSVGLWESPGMHQSAMNRMSDCIDKHLVTTRHYDVLDFGSFINKGQDAHHRSLLAEHDITYTGVDIQAGRNVDHVMVKPFTIPLPSNSQDVVITGQVFEHIPFP